MYIVLCVHSGMAKYADKHHEIHKHMYKVSMESDLDRRTTRDCNVIFIHTPVYTCPCCNIHTSKDVKSAKFCQHCKQRIVST